MSVGQKYGVRNAGYYALRSLRIEKFFAFWGQDLDSFTTPLECGREFRVKFDKVCWGVHLDLTVKYSCGFCNLDYRTAVATKIAFLNMRFTWRFFWSPDLKERVLQCWSLWHLLFLVFPGEKLSTHCSWSCNRWHLKPAIYCQLYFDNSLKMHLKRYFIQFLFITIPLDGLVTFSNPHKLPYMWKVTWRHLLMRVQWIF